MGQAWRECREEPRRAAEVAVFGIDHPDLDGRFAACAAAVMAERLPTPANELGLVAYVQWVCTDPRMRPQGLGRKVGG